MEELYKLTQGWGTEGALGIRLVTNVIMLMFVIPLQLKQFDVQNGLKSLKFDMFAIAGIILVGNNMTICSLIDIIWKGIKVTPSSEFLQLSNALIFLGLAFMLLRIYTRQFSPRQVGFHDKIAKQGRKDDARDVRRETARVKLNSDRREVTREKNRKG